MTFDGSGSAPFLDVRRHGGRGGPLSVPNRGRAVLPGSTFFLFGAATSPSHWAFLRAAFRARRIASASSRAAFSDGFS